GKALLSIKNLKMVLSIFKQKINYAPKEKGISLSYLPNPVVPEKHLRKRTFITISVQSCRPAKFLCEFTLLFTYQGQEFCGTTGLDREDKKIHFFAITKIKRQK